jgi:outer membrane lipoprotein SlyB
MSFLHHRVTISQAACGLVLAACIQQAPPALDYGTVLTVEPAAMDAENSGAGGLTGAAAGGAIGSQFGHGLGAIAVTLGGIIVGAEAGAVTETSLQSSSGLRYTLQLTDGRILTIVQHRNDGDPILVPGTRIEVETIGRMQRVLPASPS